MEKDSKCGWMLAVDRFHLRRESVSGRLEAQSDIKEGRWNWQIPLVSERISLHSSNRIFLDFQCRWYFSHEERSVTINILDSSPSPIFIEEINSGFRCVRVEDACSLPGEIFVRAPDETC